MAAPSFARIVFVSGTTAKSADLNSMFAAIAGYLGNDQITTDNIYSSSGPNILTTDGSELTINVPNLGGSHKFHLTIGGTHVLTVDGSGNVVIKGTLTQNGSPT